MTTTSPTHPPLPTRVLAEARRSPVLAVTIVLLILVALVGVFAPWIAPYPEDALGNTAPDRSYIPPSSDHWFGTDHLGRDVFSRVVYGTRFGLVVSVAVVCISLVIGIVIGLLAGYIGGWWDEGLMRVTDVFLAVPGLLLALALASALNPGLIGATIALSVTWWPWYTRIIRGEVLSVMGRKHIEACRALGLSHTRVLLRHVLPNARTSLMVQASTDFGSVLLAVAALSFLGLGAQSPTPDWGLMVEQARTHFSTHWWMGTFPGLAILFVAALFYLLGDGLRDRLDPKHTTSTGSGGTT
ncbi:ABC transporter permease [Lipingzhangella sp. LS1_29]|uniref:ABC transporter permease n=1 Tax=Lipingzhangella rawalii TaxID=2055835 RepID=A0ABU2H2N8_9ACTN|nr:ABC transporter permease [Lipingzhangella rawalii]MDS1269558.1 ABC transporter permease [Lipingzhangella rawalii]